MSTMTTDEIAQLGKAIAQELGPAWTAETEGMYNWQSGCSLLCHADGPTLFARHDGGRISINGEHPPGDINRHSGYPPPHISMAISRGATVLAREIQRRYLPQYLAWYTRAVAQDASYERREAGRLATQHALADVLSQGKERGHGIYDAGRRGEASWYTTVDVTGADTVDLKVSGAPRDLAAVLLRVIQQYKQV